MKRWCSQHTLWAMHPHRMWRSRNHTTNKVTRPNANTMHCCDLCVAATTHDATEKQTCYVTANFHSQPSRCVLTQTIENRKQNRKKLTLKLAAPVCIQTNAKTPPPLSLSFFSFFLSSPMCPHSHSSSSSSSSPHGVWAATAEQV